MKQITLKIPEKSYEAFLSLLKSKFSDIRIKEESNLDISKSVHEPDNTYSTSLLSEKSLSEEWLSEEDNRWDKVL